MMTALGAGPLCLNGCAPVGLLLVQVARVAGATRVLATDSQPHRLQVALPLGATAAFRPSLAARIARLWKRPEDVRSVSPLKPLARMEQWRWQLGRSGRRVAWS